MDLQKAAVGFVTNPLCKKVQLVLQLTHFQKGAFGFATNPLQKVLQKMSKIYACV